MTEDQARTRRTLYWLLIGSMLLSLASTAIGWQQRNARKRQLQEMKQELTEMQQQIDALEKKAAEMKLKAGKAGEEPVTKEAAFRPGK